jgi:hypothetical protein
MTELVPALDNHARLRVAATPLDREALPMVLARQSGWMTKTYPIEFIDAQGERRATWPGRFPLPWIDARRQEFEEAGMAHAYAQEYLCQPEDPASKAFTASMFQVQATVHIWEPVFAFYDPARTVKATSATTGWACWSWIGRRMVVWDGGAEPWQPDQIIDHIFSLDNGYSPVLIGVELDGLHEFIMQPLRQEQLRRGTSFLFGATRHRAASYSSSIACSHSSLRARLPSPRISRRLDNFCPSRAARSTSPTRSPTRC